MIPSTQIMKLPLHQGGYSNVWTMATNQNNQSVRLNCNQIVQPIQDAIDMVNNCQNTITTLQNSNNLLTLYKNWSKQIIDSHNVYRDCCETHKCVNNKYAEHIENIGAMTNGKHYYLSVKCHLDQTFVNSQHPTQLGVGIYNERSDNRVLVSNDAAKLILNPDTSEYNIDLFFTCEMDCTDAFLIFVVNKGNNTSIQGYENVFLHIDYARLYDLDVAPTETLQSLHNSISSLNSQVSTLTTDRNKWKKMYEDHMSTHSTSGGGTTTGKWYIKCYDCGYEWGPFNSEADARTKETQLNSDLGEKDACDRNHSGDEGYTHYTTYVYLK